MNRPQPLIPNVLRRLRSRRCFCCSSFILFVFLPDRRQLESRPGSKPSRAGPRCYSQQLLNHEAHDQYCTKTGKRLFRFENLKQRPMRLKWCSSSDSRRELTTSIFEQMRIESTKTTIVGRLCEVAPSSP